MSDIKDENMDEVLLEAEITSEEEEIAEEVEQLVEKLEKKLKKSEENYLRLVAEYDNYRKRTSKERDGIYPQAQADTVCKILPVLDNFDRAMEFETGSEDYAKGIEMIYKNFREILDGLCVEPVANVGDTFDPQFHNAVMHIEDPEQGENVITQVLQQGYKIGDRVVRHASVQIAN